MPVLHNAVLPFYEEGEIEIEAVLIDKGREYRGTDAHPYELYLALNDVEHHGTKLRSPRRPTASSSASAERPWTRSSGWPSG